MLLAVAVALPLAEGWPSHPPAEQSCRDRQFRWSNGQPAINLRHVFCGEIRSGRPKGLHSTRLVDTSALIRSIERRVEEKGGIYSAVVVFINGDRKLSTFFPDHCTVDQLIRSIAHAAASVRERHPEWGMIGLSAPAADLETFCLDNTGQPFEIRLGVLANGRINTAFPN